MTFASAIVKQSSERSFLARISPKRNITSTLAIVSGTEYSVTIPYNVKRVTVNGIDLTEITSGSTVAGQFKYDQSTQILLVNTATAPNVTTGVVVAFYRVYLCTGAGTVAYDDPSTSTGLPQQWEPRLADSPSIGSYFTDAIQGVFSFNDLNLTVVNGDSWFQSFLTGSDSFNNAAVVVWYFVDDIANIQRVYTGSVSKIAAGSQVSLTVSDSFNRLRAPAFMGDLESEATFRTSTYPTMDAGKSGTPNPFITGDSSPYSSRFIALNYNPLSVQELDETVVNEAVCLTAVSPNTDANRTWGLHRAEFGTTVRNNTFATVAAVLYLGEADFLIRVTGTTANYRVGETFRWTQGGFTWGGHVARTGSIFFGTQSFLAADVNTGTDRITLTAHGMTTGNRISFSGTLPAPLVAQTVYYVNVINANLIEVCATLALAQAGTQINLTSTGGAGTKDIFKFDSGTSYNLYVFNCCQQNNPTISASGSNLTAGVAVTVLTPAIAVILRYGSEVYYNTLYLRYESDYLITSSTSSSGNRIRTLIFNDSFEKNAQEDKVYPNASSFAGDAPNLTLQASNFILNPTQHKVFWAIGLTPAASHGSLLSNMVQAVGLTPNVASFTAADAALVASTQMQIPAKGEQDYGTYIDYAQKVLRSTLGYLTINNVGEIVYNLIAAPAPSSTIGLDNSQMTGIDIDYTGIVKSMVFYNKDYPTVPVVEKSSNVCRFLHETENVDRFDHVLAAISARADAIFNLRKNRFALYKHSVAHIESLFNLGDDVTINNPDVLGGSGTTGAKIIGLTKSADSIDVESTDLLST